MDTAATPPSLHVVELIGRLERVCAGDRSARAVRLVSNDAPARLAALQSLYQRLVEHPRFGGAWPWSLPRGSLVPAVPGSTLPGLPPRMIWLGLCATPEPAVEPAQLLEQFEQLGRFPDLDAWVHEAAAGTFAAALGDAAFAGQAERVAAAFGFLDRLPGAGADLAGAMRTLASVTTDVPLLADGGLLGLDGPTPTARGLVAAGWIEHLARSAPVVLIVDEVEHAGSFVTTLVESVLAGDAAVLVVLAGGPAQADDAALALAGPLGTVTTAEVQPFSAPAGDAGYVAAALATLAPSGVVTADHLAVVAEALGIVDDALSLQDELVATGWLRPLTAGTHAFTTATRRRAALAESATLVPDVVAHATDLARDVVGRSIAAEPLARLVAADGLAALAGRTSDAAWTHAAMLGRSGESTRAARASTALASAPLRRAIVAAWRRGHAGAGLVATRPPAEHDAGATAAEEAERRLVLAAAANDPDVAAAHLDAALPLLLGIGGPVDATSRLRLAAARLFLTVGRLDGLAQALGPGAPEWLSPSVVKRLVELHGSRHRPGLVARSAELAELGRAVDVLRHVVPGSLAVAHVELALATLLERYDRVRSGDDTATQLATVAATAFERRGESARVDAWRARTLVAACALRRGDASGAIVVLGAVVDEAGAAVRGPHPAMLDAVAWLGRALAAADRLEPAATLFERLRALPSAPDDAQWLRWRATGDGGLAGVHLAAGRYDDAAALATHAVAAHTTAGRRDDEELLAARLLLGTALVRLGHHERAQRELDEVVARRAANDLPDGARLLAARHARAECLTARRCYADALAELDVVVDQRSRQRPATDPSLVAARIDRARCLLALRRWPAALADLEPALAVLQARHPPDDERVVLARQHRSVCLQALGRAIEATTELDAILAATATWTRDHPLVVAVRRQRDDLAALAPSVPPR